MRTIKTSKRSSRVIRGPAAKLLLMFVGVMLMGTVTAEGQLDFSHVDSREKAEALVEQGKLFRILLFPAEFGGQEIPANIVYVPEGIPEIKDQITGTLIRFVQDGLIDNLIVTPVYKGESIVPSRIDMQTTHSDRDGTFNPTIEIW